MAPAEDPRKMSMLVKVRNHHIDGYGHVNNAKYLTYLEDARTDFFEDLGFSLAKLREQHIRIFLTQITVQYKRPAVLGDILRIFGWFFEITNRKATWRHEIYNEADKKLLLTGTATGMFLNNEKLVTIPPEIKQAMQQLYIPE